MGARTKEREQPQQGSTGSAALVPGAPPALNAYAAVEDMGLPLVLQQAQFKVVPLSRCRVRICSLSFNCSLNSINREACDGEAK